MAPEAHAAHAWGWIRRRVFIARAHGSRAHTKVEVGGVLRNRARLAHNGDLQRVLGRQASQWGLHANLSVVAERASVARECGHHALGGLVEIERVRLGIVGMLNGC